MDSRCGWTPECIQHSTAWWDPHPAQYGLVGSCHNFWSVMLLSCLHRIKSCHNGGLWGTAGRCRAVLCHLVTFRRGVLSHQPEHLMWNCTRLVRRGVQAACGHQEDSGAFMLPVWQYCEYATPATCVLSERAGRHTQTHSNSANPCG